MANKTVLVTSNGVYAVEDGKTKVLTQGEKVSLESEQADKLVKRGRVELVNNTKSEPSKSKAEK